MLSERNDKVSAPDLEGATTSSLKSGQDGQKITLGVLLVHGIGMQQRGETLVQAGDALHHWLCKWLDMDIGVDNADIAPSTPDSTTPAHARVVFPASDKRAPESWLLAECHWAEAFGARPYSEFVEWSRCI